jgi:fucose 4-O-acetylase-like acetyltransferase
MGNDTNRQSVAANNSPPQNSGQTQPLERNDTIELLRILAASGVIWFHLETTPFKSVGLAGLIFFLIVSVVFQSRAAGRASGAGYFRKRVPRLLVPWAAWFAVYGLLNLARGKDLFPFTSGFLSSMVAGPWIGLWYLPFSIVAACLVYVIVQLTPKVGYKAQFLGWSLASIAALVLASKVRTEGVLPMPWAQWVQSAPSLPIGLALALGVARLPELLWMVVVLQGALLLTCILLYPADPGLALSYGIGSLLATAGFLFNRHLSRRVSEVSVLCLGVYLVHGVVLSGFRIVPWVTQHYLPWYVLTVVVSFIVVALLRRVPYLAGIV